VTPRRSRPGFPTLLHRLIATLVLAVCGPAAATAGALTPGQPLLLTGNESAAYAEGARGVFYNPAGLGVRHRIELFGSATSFEGGGRIHRWAAGLGGFALHGEQAKDASRRYGFTQAAGGTGLRWGLTGDWEVDARTHEVVADQRLGVLSRPAPWLALGGVADHLFQAARGGERRAREYTLALGLRPLALNPARAHGWGTRLTLTSDVIMAEAGRSDQARVRFGGELEALPGVLLRAAVEDRRGFSLGVLLRGVNGCGAAQRVSVDGRRRYDSYAVSFHSGEERTVLAGRVERRVAVVRAAGALGDDALSGFSLMGGSDVTPVRPLHDQLQRALEDPLTRGVFLDLRGVGNMAQLEELRPRLARLRAAGKPVVAFMEYGVTRGDLYLAGACNRIVVAPEIGPVALGLRVERRYYRGLLASLGIKVERTSYGKYKSAYRNYSVDSTSDADREAIERGLDVSQELFVSALAADRGMDRGRLLTLLDGRPWRASDLRQAGLIDSVGYREDALAVLGRLCGLGEKPRRVALDRRSEARREWTVPAPVAVVYASGGIETGRSGSDLLMGPSMGSETVIAQLERAFTRRGVKAVLLRVESPGGSALASDLIHHATLRLKRETKKPLIVSMGSVAGSGGYCISTGADCIYADRFTSTGSIGVVSIKPSFEQVYAKHGVRQDDFERGAWMRGWSTNRDWTGADQAIADSVMLRFYHRFVELVAAGRGMTWDEVRDVAQGRVWMGEDALERRLVDRIGGLEDAVAEARRRARVPEGARIRLLEYRRPSPGLLQRIIGRTVGEAWRGATRMPAPGAMLYWTDDDATP
jgi:protease-4